MFMSVLIDSKHFVSLIWIIIENVTNVICLEFDSEGCILYLITIIAIDILLLSLIQW